MQRQPKDGDLLIDEQGYYLRAQGVWKHISKQQYDARQRGWNFLAELQSWLSYVTGKGGPNAKDHSKI